MSAGSQVLSNPELRQRYDQHGAEGVSDVNLADSAEFFGALFGSTQFEHLARDRPPYACELGLTLAWGLMQSGQHVLMLLGHGACSWRTTMSPIATVLVSSCALADTHLVRFQWG